MKLTILGNNSALPAYGRFPTAQVLEIQNQLVLIDCGEGTQMRLQQFGIRRSRIRYILISHEHGDHFYGLIGLVSSFSLLGRTAPLDIFAPREVREQVLRQLTWDLGYPLTFHLLEPTQQGLLMENNLMTCTCFPVDHSVPTHGFKIVEKKRKRVLVPQRLQELEIPRYFYQNLSRGENYVKQDGTVIPNEWVTLPGPKPAVYVYAADTRYQPSLAEVCQGATLLYHEATYLHDNLDKAIQRKHSTAKEAGMLAAAAGAEHLLIGHFSSKYRYLEPLLMEARAEFPACDLALEGASWHIEPGSTRLFTEQ